MGWVNCSLIFLASWSSYWDKLTLDDSHMNDPHVVALHYTVTHGSSVDYRDARPLRFENPTFRLEVNNNRARFDFKEHFTHEGEALQAIGAFIRDWEFEVGLRQGPGLFKLNFEKSEIVDRNPSPPKLLSTSPSTSGVKNLRASSHSPGSITTAKLTIVKRHYPPPPSAGAVDPNDPDVSTMCHRFEGYRQGREYLPGMAYFCRTMLTDYLCKGDKEASKKYGISRKVFKEISQLTSGKGGPVARKAAGIDADLSNREKKFLEKAISEMIYRTAQIAADENQDLPKITLSDLPSLSE